MHELYFTLGAIKGQYVMADRSINQEVIPILKAYLATPPSQHRQAGEPFLTLCGSWNDDKSVQTIADE